jgi:methylthioribose-1-phosphate isomerase
MKVDGTHYRSLWWDTQAGALQIVDQRWLPHDFRIATITSLDGYAEAIRGMWVRGAPLIGATAAYGMALAMVAGCSDANLDAVYGRLHATRPTAINLKWALDDVTAALRPLAPSGPCRRGVDTCRRNRRRRRRDQSPDRGARPVAIAADRGPERASG